MGATSRQVRGWSGGRPEGAVCTAREGGGCLLLGEEKCVKAGLLAAEEFFERTCDLAPGAKALVHYARLTARLKAAPFQNRIEFRLFPQLRYKLGIFHQIRRNRNDAYGTSAERIPGGIRNHEAGFGPRARGQTDVEAASQIDVAWPARTSHRHCSRSADENHAA